MVSNTVCGIAGCSNSRKNAPNAGLFHLPSIVTTDKRSELSRDRRSQWLSKINHKNLTACQLAEKNSTLHVCGKHFINGKPSALYETTDPNWIPTVNLGYELVTISSPESTVARNDRRKRRSNNLNQINESTEKKKKVVEENVPQQEIQEIEAGVKSKEIQTDASFITSIELENAELKRINTKLAQEIAELKSEIQKYKFNEGKFKDDDQRVSYYTDSVCFNTLMTLFNLVKPAIKKGKLLNPFEKFMLCMMRLRLGIPVIDLADRFQISKTTAADTFMDVLDILYVKISPLIIWPERPELETSMPVCFRNKFGCKITTIIDCFELFIDRPTNLTARNLTWSNYKSHNTGKYLIGITPQGTICFISKGWGGRASDQHITENSKFLKYVVYNDVIMADRGFSIVETLGTLGAKLEIPSFTKGQDQMRAEDVEDTLVIANVRIHVEQVIGNLRKKYSILNGTLPIDYLLSKGDGTEKLTTLDKIVHEACALINLCTLWK